MSVIRRKPGCFLRDAAIASCAACRAVKKEGIQIKNSIKKLAQWLGVLTGVWALFHFVFPIVIITGSSMKPTFKDGDWVICNALDHSYQRGDVVIFRGAKTKEVPYEILIKRVAALPGDTVDMDSKTGAIYVNGKIAAEREDASVPTLETLQFPVKVPDGQLFVLGDNPPQSMDSRYAALGFVPAQSVIGVAKIKLPVSALYD